MAVFPDRIVLKNTTDSVATLKDAIRTGGTSAVVPGEIVVRNAAGVATLYTIDSNGTAVAVKASEDVVLDDLLDVEVGNVWYTNFETGSAVPTLNTSTLSTEQAFSGTQSLKSTTSGIGATINNAFPYQHARYDYWSFRFYAGLTL